MEHLKLLNVPNNMFISYPKIHRLGKEETDGILEHELCVEEKIDGANTSIWMEDGILHMASRSHEIKEGFNGFVDYVNANNEIKHLLCDSPSFRLYGEWLVRHTVAYKETSYKKFYLFDIMTSEKNFLPAEMVIDYAEKYGITHPQVFGSGKFTEEQLQEFVGKSELGEVGEGVVLKTHNFINKFGDVVYAKIVTEKFKENNALVFGGNNKHSETYWEMYIVNKYATLERVRKIMQKVEPTIEGRLDLVHIPRIASTCYHDMITEEIWEIQKKVGFVNFKTLQSLATKKFIQIYKDIIAGDLSVADTGI